MDNECKKQQEIVLELIKKSWEEFQVDYENKKIKYYSKNNPEGFLVCWKEDDIVLQLSSLFYKNLKVSELKDEGIEVHSQTEISENKFDKEYSFNKKISELNKKLNRKKGTKPDFIITKEDDYGSLWLIGEVKYFRTWQWKDRVEKDIKELNELKNLNICAKTCYLLADAYLHEKNKKGWKELQEILQEERQRKNLDYLDLIIMCAKKTSECQNRDFFF